MSTLSTRLATLAAGTVDTITALVEAAWPRSITSREIERLAQDGYPRGSVCDVYFLVSFDAPECEGALGALQRAGFTIRDGGPLGAFLTVKAPVRLRAFDLFLASARLDRLLAPYGGFGTVIGPALTARLGGAEGRAIVA